MNIPSTISDDRKLQSFLKSQKKYWENILFSLKKINFIRRIVQIAKRLYFFFSVLLTGRQQRLHEFIWAWRYTSKRGRELIKQGYFEFQLMDINDYNQFSFITNELLTNEGRVLPTSEQSWAIDERVRISSEHPKIKPYVDKIIQSESFKQAMDRCFKGAEYEVSSMIWRNYPFNFKKEGVETNSSYFHVDNGGELHDRLFINIFMYLSDISLENGPFTFFDLKSSCSLNRKYCKTIFNRGNLRTLEMVEKMSKSGQVHLGLMTKGRALLIDNQSCLHRAGFCKSGYRDIIEILVREKIY